MRKVVGVALLVAGVGVGGSFLASPSHFVQVATQPSEDGPGPVGSSFSNVIGAIRPATSTVTPTVVTVPRASTSWTQATKVLLHPNDVVSITRELQKELKRVACYDGEVNAVWTSSARKAMKDFLDWVNASLR